VSRARAVVFAYHDVGVRCLRTLLSGGVAVPLVVTVPDDPREHQWFASVAATAADYGLDVVAPEDAHAPRLIRRVSELQPDFVFSFYYRSMLAAPLLRAASRGALNMHGSLLPKYRGRAPVNWAILRGEHETGATLHYMVERADAGDIVDSQAVPILLDDDAREVFTKVTVAAETVLARSLPALIAGTAARRPQPILAGHYASTGHVPPSRFITWYVRSRRPFPVPSATWPASAGRYSGRGLPRGSAGRAARASSVRAGGATSPAAMVRYCASSPRRTPAARSISQRSRNEQRTSRCRSASFGGGGSR